jgi:hypothetical protein
MTFQVRDTLMAPTIAVDQEGVTLRLKASTWSAPYVFSIPGGTSSMGYWRVSTDTLTGAPTAYRWYDTQIPHGSIRSVKIDLRTRRFEIRGKGSDLPQLLDALGQPQPLNDVAFEVTFGSTNPESYCGDFVQPRSSATKWYSKIAPAPGDCTGW